MNNRRLLLFMELRRHPLMKCGQRRSWPPVWIPLDTPPTRVLVGEFGILKDVSSSRFHRDRCELIIEYEGLKFTATLLFDDRDFCWLITHLLKININRSIKDIGDLDLLESPFPAQVQQNLPTPRLLKRRQ